MNYERKPIAIPEWSMYECDTEGNVYNKKGSKPLKYSVNHRGYCIVNLYDHNIRKGFGLHTLIAVTFIPNPENKTQVNHIDGDKTNNKVGNLEWVTPIENTHHSIEVLGHDNKGINNVNHKEVYGYDVKTHELKYCFDSLMDAAIYFVNNPIIKTTTNPRYVQHIISQVALGKRKTYKGCKWAYNKLE